MRKCACKLPVAKVTISRRLSTSRYTSMVQYASAFGGAEGVVGLRVNDRPSAGHFVGCVETVKQHLP